MSAYRSAPISGPRPVGPFPVAPVSGPAQRGAYQRGWAARERGEKRSDCPYMGDVACCGPMRSAMGEVKGMTWGWQLVEAWLWGYDDAGAPSCSGGAA